MKIGRIIKLADLQLELLEFSQFESNRTNSKHITGILFPHEVYRTNPLANMSLCTHMADMELHQHSCGVVYLSTSQYKSSICQVCLFGAVQVKSDNITEIFIKYFL